MNHLPTEIINIIIHLNLSEKDIFKLKRTCRELNNFITIKRLLYQANCNSSTLLFSIDKLYWRSINNYSTTSILVGFEYEFGCFVASKYNEFPSEKFLTTFHKKIESNNSMHMIIMDEYNFKIFV